LRREIMGLSALLLFGILFALGFGAGWKIKAMSEPKDIMEQAHKELSWAIDTIEELAEGTDDEEDMKHDLRSTRLVLERIKDAM